jgi:hypothetical protein
MSRQQPKKNKKKSKKKSKTDKDHPLAPAVASLAGSVVK